MRHHYIPQFLLKPWLAGNADGRVEIYRLDLDGVPSSRKTPKHTGFEENLYALTIPVVAGMNQQAVEKHFLMHVDNLGALVRRKLDEHGLRSLTTDDRVNWARFLMSLRIRQPDIVQMIRTDAAANLRVNLAAQPEQYEELAQLNDPSTLEEWTEQHFPGLIENIGMSFFHKLVDNPAIGDKLLRMRWWLWDCASVPHDLLLADHPCVFTHGIDDPRLVIALPISPKKIFIATQSDETADLLRRQRPKDLVVKLNEYSIGQTRTRVYARDTAPARFIRNRARQRPVGN